MTFCRFDFWDFFRSSKHYGHVLKPTQTPRTCSLFGSFVKGWRHRHAGPELPSRPCRYAMGGGSTSSSSSSSSSGSKQKRKQRDDDINVAWMMEDGFFCFSKFLNGNLGVNFCWEEVDGIW